eukprot:364942-Chlamydomonas_euryale.AAC.25
MLGHAENFQVFHRWAPSAGSLEVVFAVYLKIGCKHVGHDEEADGAPVHLLHAVHAVEAREERGGVVLNMAVVLWQHLHQGLGLRLWTQMGRGGEEWRRGAGGKGKPWRGGDQHDEHEVASGAPSCAPVVYIHSCMHPFIHDPVYQLSSSTRGKQSTFEVCQGVQASPSGSQAGFGG